MSDAIPTSILWMGRPVNDLDRDELLKVVDYLANECNSLRQERTRLAGSVDWKKYLMTAA